MRLLSLIAPVLLLSPPSLASTLGRRDAQDVYDGISAIDSAVRALTASLTAYQGGISSLSPVTTASLAVHEANRRALNATQASSSGIFPSADSRRIVDHVNDSVGVSIPAGVKVLESKRPLFDQAQVGSLIEATVNLLRHDHETFSAAVGERLSPDTLADGLAAAGKIEEVLVGASLYFAV